MTRGETDHNGVRARSQAERVYAGLRERLLRGDLPVGRRLVEQQLAADFHTSRTPVREALRRLEGDGHIVRGPGGGLSPSAPSVKSMRELYEVRLAIEELVARRASTSGDRDRLEAIERDWRDARVRLARHAARSRAARTSSTPTRAFISRSRARAATTSPRCCSPTSTTASGSCACTTSRPTTGSRRRSPSTWRSSAACWRGDADAAAAFMRAHVQRSALVVRERVGEALARMSEPR